MRYESKGLTRAVTSRMRLFVPYVLLIETLTLILLCNFMCARDRLNKIGLDGESNRCRYRSNGMKRGSNVWRLAGHLCAIKCNASRGENHGIVITLIVRDHVIIPKSESTACILKYRFLLPV